MNRKKILLIALAALLAQQAHAFRYTVRNVSNTPILYLFTITNDQGVIAYPAGHLQPGQSVTEPRFPARNVHFENITVQVRQTTPTGEVKWVLSEPYAQRHLDPAQNPECYRAPNFNIGNMAQQFTHQNNEPHFIYTFANDGGDFTKKSSKKTLHQAAKKQRLSSILENEPTS